jgi:hypothetical protein
MRALLTYPDTLGQRTDVLLVCYEPKFGPKKWQGMTVRWREGKEEENKGRAKGGMEETGRGKRMRKK